MTSRPEAVLTVEEIEQIRTFALPCFDSIAGVSLKKLLAAALEGIASRERVREMMRAIERDRSIVATGTVNLRRAIDRRRWLLEDGKGSYAYDDETYKAEFGEAIREIEAAAEPLVRLAADLSNSPTEQSEIRAARAALSPQEAQAPSPPQEPRFAETSCSQCGRSFGPGNSGYSHCDQHQPKQGAALSFEGGLINLSADRDGNLCFADDDLDWEQSDEGKQYRFVNLPRSEFEAIRDFLVKHLAPPHDETEEQEPE